MKFEVTTRTPPMVSTSARPRGLGVLGGMGPLVSAEFLDTLYRFHRGRVEQEGPVVLMYSNPRIADRTATFLSGDESAIDRLVAELEANLRLLCQPGIEQLVICCVTVHHVFDRLPADLRRRTRSLLDVVLNEVIQRRRRHLMVCTLGTRRLRLFERHPSWRAAEPWIVLPSNQDQRLIHDAIYELKKNHDPSVLLELLEPLTWTYGVDAVIAACTELHLLARHLQPLAEPGSVGPAVELLDPLTLIARDWMESETHEPAIHT
jgi:aspartate racemase